MLQAKLNICLICLASIVFAGSEPNGIKAESVWRNNRDYTFMWWAYGLRDPSNVFHIQTSHYGLSFDFDDFELNTFGPIANAASEEEVLFQDNTLIESLDRATLQCVIEYNGLRYEALGNDLDVSITRGTLKHVYPIRIHAPDGAEFAVTGGLGYVPMTFSGLPNYRRYILEIKVNDLWMEVDQSVHGHDFW